MPRATAKEVIRMPMKREDYKAIKHMDKDQLTAYLTRVYRRGFDAGAAAMVKKSAPASPQAEPPSPDIGS